MLIKYPFFGSTIANLKIIEQKGLGTLATDGKAIYYDPVFLTEADHNKRMFLFAHEVCHVAFNHILRAEGKDKKLWNVATDAIVNTLLENDGIKLPDDAIDIKSIQERGLDVTNLLEYNVEQLYEKLLKNKKGQPSQNFNNNNQNQAGSQQESNCSNDNNQNENNTNDNHDFHKMQNEPTKQHQEEQIIDEKEAFKSNEKARKKQLEELLDTLSKESSEAGKNTNSKKVTFNNVGNAKQLVDWRFWLREAVNMDVDWSYSK